MADHSESIITPVNSVHSRNNLKYSEFELNEKIGLLGDDNIERCKQLVYNYFLKSEDLENKCEILQKNVEDLKEAWEKAKDSKDSALKERETMTLKYAKGEKQMLNEKELKEKAENRCKTLENEIRSLNKKLQLQADEKSRISTLYDNKIHELKTIKSENEGIMNQNVILKNELKLCQIALKNQAELNNKAQTTIENLKEGINSIAEEKCSLEINGKKMTDLMIKLEELETDKNDKMQHLKELDEAYNELNEKYNGLLGENSILIERIQTLEFDISKYKSLLEHGASNINISGEMTEENVYKGNDVFEGLKEKLNLLEMQNAELENDVKACRIREKESLFFSQQLAEKNAILQSENDNLTKSLNDLDMEKKNLENVFSDCNQKYLDVLKQVNDQKESSKHEKLNLILELETLKKHLSEQSIQNLSMQQQLLDQQEEISILKRKHSRLLRELQKKMLPLRDNHDEGSSPSSMSLVSNVSKSTELSNEQIEVIHAGNAFNKFDITAKVLQLQEINAKKSEQIDFLQDKMRMLLLEQQDKRLFQFYFFNEQNKALTSNRTDIVKRFLKRLGDIMTSLYHGRLSDHNLTLKLCSEINSKLQAILEDVLLKNILLKESMHILGEEIDKLKKKTDVSKKENCSVDSC